jgi:hypothetical protein
MLSKVLYYYINQPIEYLKEISYYNDFIKAKDGSYFESDRYSYDDI